MTKLVLTVAAVLALGVSGQDNTQTVNVPNARTPVTFDVLDHNHGRGGPAYGIYSFWFSEFVGGNYIPISGWKHEHVFGAENGDPDFLPTFQAYNNAQSLPLIISPVDVSDDSDAFVLSARFSTEPGRTYTHVLQGTFTPSTVGTSQVVVTYTSNGNTVARTLITFNVANTLPTVSASASPLTLTAGGSVSFTATAGDDDGHALSYLWTFGDGSTSTEQNPAHVYAAPGGYAVMLTVSDGFATVNAQTIFVDVAGDGRTPTARFTTDDVVAFVGSPMVFDGILSTDPQNSTLLYSWSFGDNTPPASGVRVPHVYDTEGTYTITLTVTDAEGLTATTSREFEVLPADAQGTFNAELNFKAKYNRNLLNKDTLTLFARVNVGDTPIVNGVAVAVQIGAKRIEGTLDKKLRTTGAARFTVKANLRRQAAGTVEIKLSARSVGGLGDALDGLGALTGDEIELPVSVEVAGRSFVLLVPSEFSDVNGKGKGDGDF